MLDLKLLKLAPRFYPAVKATTLLPMIHQVRTALTPAPRSLLTATKEKTLKATTLAHQYYLTMME